MQCPCKTLHFLCYSSLRSASPRQCLSSLCRSHSMRSLPFPKPCRAVSCRALPRHCPSSPSAAKPKQIIAAPGNAFSVLCQTKPQPIHAQPSISDAALCCAVPDYAKPTLFRAALCPGSALRLRAMPFQSLAKLCQAPAVLCQAKPLHIAALRGCAKPQPSSSQVNRPLPLLRHWPMPRSAP